MANAKPIRLPGDFTEALADLLKVKPPASSQKIKKGKRRGAKKKKD